MAYLWRLAVGSRTGLRSVWQIQHVEQAPYVEPQED